MNHGWLAGVAVVAVLTVGCGKINQGEKQAASNIIAGLIGGTGESLANSTAALRPPEYRASRHVGSALSQRMRGVFWLTRFQLESGTLLERRGTRADLTLNAGICGSAGTLQGCTAGCNDAMTAYTVSCALNDGAGYSCGGDAYAFTDASFAITADFADTGGSVGSATGTFDIGIAIAGDISGGSLGGDRLDCSMRFTIDIEAMKAGAVETLSPSCDDFRCSYGGEDITCAEIQSQMQSSSLTCG